MTKIRLYPCHRPGCRKRAVKLGGYCSRSCNRAWHLAMQTPAERSARMRRARALQQRQDINRMVQRVKALADGEEARLVMAWRYGKIAAKSARYRLRKRQQQGKAHAA
jgi:hypothetical protein